MVQGHIKLGCFSPPLKQVMQKCTSIHDSELGSIHRQNCFRACSGLLLKRWNSHYERYFSHQWALAGIGQILPRSQGWSLKNWKLTGNQVTAYIWSSFSTVLGGEGVNSTSKVLQCSIFLFLAHHIQLAFYFMNYLYNSLSSNCGISKLPGKIQSWKREWWVFQINF